MFWFKPRLPLDDESRQWVEDSFQRLIGLFGKDRLLKTKLVLPEQEFFPDPIEATQASLDGLLKRLCGYMQVDPTPIELHVIEDPVTHMVAKLPFYSGKTASEPAGLYYKPESESKIKIAVNVETLSNPIRLIATLAHELAHVLLLAGGKVGSEEPDMEPLTDLMTVYAGLGVFNANATHQFHRYTDTARGRHGWNSSRLGYLSQPMFGYALALFAFERGEVAPAWVSYLTTNVRSYCKTSLKYLIRNTGTSQGHR